MGRTVESVRVPDDLLTGGDNQGEAPTHGIADVVEDKGVIGVGDGNHRDPGLLADRNHTEPPSYLFRENLGRAVINHLGVEIDKLEVALACQGTYGVDIAHDFIIDTLAANLEPALQFGHRLLTRRDGATEMEFLDPMS